MKKSSKSSLKKRSHDISLQHKNEASYKFSKKNFCTWQKKGLELKGLINFLQFKGIDNLSVINILLLWENSLAFYLFLWEKSYSYVGSGWFQSGNTTLCYANNSVGLRLGESK